MFVCEGVAKTQIGLKRIRFKHRLWDALACWRELYEENQGDTAAMEVVLNTQLEMHVAREAMEKSLLSEQMSRMLRVRDIHRFVALPTCLAEVKTQILEHILLEHSLLTRWAAVREALLQHANTLCNLQPMPPPARIEALKRQFSDPTSALGQLLVATALFNFDQDEERPPLNWMVHFKSRAFPEHCWRSSLGENNSWRPANPLCRWEYLATDLVHSLVRQGSQWSQRRQKLSTTKKDTLSNSFPSATPQEQSALRKIYCLFQPLTKEGQRPPHQAASNNPQQPTPAASPPSPPQQIELLPLTAQTFLPQLHRFAHRRLGPQTPRLFAVLMEQLACAVPAEPLTLSLTDLSLRSAAQSDSPQRRTSRRRSLGRMLQWLQQEVCMHHVLESPSSGEQTFSRSGLLHVLRWEAPHDSPQQDTYQVKILLDSGFFHPQGDCLASHWQHLPPALFVPDPQEHPYAPALFVFIRRYWNTYQHHSWELSVESLLQSCGIWHSPSGRYQALATLKRDLDFLQQQGWLQQWNITQDHRRDCLRQNCSLKAPKPPSQLSTKTKLATTSS